MNELTFDMLVTEAMGFAGGVIATLQVIDEEKQITYRNGSIFCHDEYRKTFRRYGEDGWIAAARNTEYGGLGFPHMVRIVINDLMYGVCRSFNFC